VRVLGLDIGERRVGVALSDPEATMATPYRVLDSQDAMEGRALLDIVEEFEVTCVVVGLPLSLDGGFGPQAEKIRTVADRLAGRLPVPVVFHDERLSSAEAGRRMAESGMSEKERRGKVDMVAAALILQGYLDAQGHSSMSDESGDCGEAGESHDQA